MAQSDDSADFLTFRQTGSARALARVFDRLAPELLLVAAHVAPRGVEPEDLVQATFLAAIEHAGRWDAARPLLPWLIGILVQCARNERRRAGRSVDPQRLARHEPADPADEAEAKELAEQLERAVAALPDPYRHLLVLRLAHGLSPIEIAHALGRPLNTVKTQLARGRDILRQALPAGLAGAALLALGSGRALAQVRKAVLARGRLLVPAATAAGVITGALVMKKTVAGLAIVVLGVATWWAWPTDAPEPAATASPVMAAGTDETAAPLAGAAKRDAAENGAAPPTRATSVGSILLRVVWPDGTPAAGVSVALLLGSGSAATTDALGEIRWPEVPAGRHTLFSSAGPSTCQVRLGELTEHRIELAGSLVIDGRVVDAEGRPARGAEVVRWEGSEASPLHRLATSNAEGRFACRTDRGGAVFARKDGHRPSPWRTLEPRQRSVTLELPLGGPAFELRGRVVDRQGKGIEAAFVLVTTLDRQSPRGLPVIAMRTGAEGEFRTHNLGPGPWCVAVKAKGFAPEHTKVVVADDNPPPLLVRLSEGARVHGTVRTTAEPALDAVVACSWRWVQDEVDASHGLYASAVMEHARIRSQYLQIHAAADAAGHYVLEHAPAGSVHLHAAAPGAHEATRDADLQHGDELRWDAMLDAGLAITGKVVGSDGEAAPRWRVTAARTEGGGEFYQVQTDKDGRFVLAGLTDGDYDLRVTLPLTGSARMDGAQLPWAKERVRAGARDVVLRLAHRKEEGAYLKGRILDVGGAPVVHEVAVIAIASKEESIPVQCPVAGFEIGPLPPGTYRIRGCVHGWGRLSLGEHRLVAGQTCDLGSIRLGGLGSARVELRLRTGEPVASFDLQLRDKLGNVQDARGQGGVAATSPLPPGLYEAHLWGERLAPLRHRVQILADRQTPLALVVDPVPAVRSSWPPRGPRSGAG